MIRTGMAKKKQCPCGCGKHIHGNFKNGRRLHSEGYVEILKHNHPRATKAGYVPEQILIAEQVLGKYLPPKALVHHVDRNRQNNINSNLVICENKAYHNLLHRRERALKECNNPNWRICKYCHKYDDIDNLFITKHDTSYYHKECARTTRREYNGYR